MAIGRTSSREYDLQRALRVFDSVGGLPARTAELYRHIEGSELDLARAFWRRYRASEEVSEQIGDAELEKRAQELAAYFRRKYGEIDRAGWVADAYGYVERTLASDVTLSTLLTSLSAETEEVFALIRANVADKDEQLQLMRTSGDLELFQIDVFTHHAISITRAEAEQSRAVVAFELYR